MKTFDFILSLIPIGIGILVVGAIAFQIAWALLNPEEVEKLKEEAQNKRNREDMFDDWDEDEYLNLIPGPMNDIGPFSDDDD